MILGLLREKGKIDAIDYFEIIGTIGTIGTIKTIKIAGFQLKLSYS